MGNPNLGEVQGYLIGIENAITGANVPLSTEVWVDELRLSQIDEHGGWAALGRVDVQLADLGTLSLSANTYTSGFGGIEQKINERAKNDLLQYDAALNIDLAKLLPKKLYASIPVYAGYNKTILTPEYDPYDLDVKYKYKIQNAGDAKDSIKNVALDESTIKTLNFTNMRFGVNGKKPKLWSLSNFDFSFSYTGFTQTNPIIQENTLRRYRGGLGYTYSGNSKFISPFKKLIKNKSAWLAPIRDFNFNYIPSLISFRADINRQYGEYVPRIVNITDKTVEKVDTSYDKYFTFDRYYNLRWDLTRSLNIDFSAVNFARVDEPIGKLDTKAKKDTVWKNFLKGGRNTLYQQRATISYSIPFNKLPLTDWITARFSYTTTYNWIAASLLAISMGNTLENSQQNSLNTEMDFNRLYNKSKWLRNITSQIQQDNNEDEGEITLKDKNGEDSVVTIPTRAEVIKGLKGKEKRLALSKWRNLKRQARIAARKNKEAGSANGLVKTAVQLATMVKRVSVNYSENYNSRIPGYKDSTQFFGQNFKSNQPGLAYIFGKQPDTAWLNLKARQGVITRDSTFNLLFTQNFDQRLSVTAQLEPLKELIIDLNLDKSFSKNYSELFKDTTGTGNSFDHLSPLAGGGFNVSYISFGTLFMKTNPNEISETFKTFQDNRLIISKRLASQNPYWQALPDNEKFMADGYATGYGRYAQDVLIPAFLAAYTGKDPNTISLLKESNPNIKSNPFGGIHALPNWRLTYTGLTNIPALSDVFSNITISHGYNASLSMNSFASALLFFDPYHYGAPAFIDTISGNYVPFFLIPNLTIQEQFAPLIGFDITTNNQTNFHFEYKKSRTLSLSLIDFQLSEVRSTEWSFGGSFRKKGIVLPFRLPFTKGKELQNDLGISLDISMRDDTQSNSRLDQANAYSTGGQKVITIQPAIDYILNNRVSLKFYFDQQRVIPYISTSAPVTNTRAGIQIQISLAQ